MNFQPSCKSIWTIHWMLLKRCKSILSPKGRHLNKQKSPVLIFKFHQCIIVKLTRNVFHRVEQFHACFYWIRIYYCTINFWFIPVSLNFWCFYLSNFSILEYFASLYWYSLEDYAFFLFLSYSCMLPSWMPTGSGSTWTPFVRWAPSVTLSSLKIRGPWAEAWSNILVGVL